MSTQLDEIVKLATGTLVEIEIWQGVLKESGIESKVVGTDLTAGVGSAFLTAVELWVTQPNAEAAAAAIREAEARKGQPEKSPVPHGRIADEKMPNQPGAHAPHNRPNNY